MVLIRMLRPVTRIGDHYDLRPGQIVDMDPKYADVLVRDGFAEYVHARAESGEGHPPASPASAATSNCEVFPSPPAPDPRLVAWLEANGFARRPDGTAWQKTVRLEDGRIVKLVVDFKHTEKGARYAYVLDEETGGWKNAENLRDHPTLLEFKAYRDKLFEAGRPKPPERTVEIPAGEEGQQLLLKMEERDEQQIIAELKGDFQSEVLRQYFYVFESGGRKIIGLSYKGVKQIALKQGNITLKDLELRETESGWIAVVKARHETRNLEVYGVAWQGKRMRLRDGSEVEDPFAIQKAVSKAQRNALRALIPETIIAEAYRAWLEMRREG